MTDAQILQLTGIPLVAMGISWVINPKAFKQLIKDMANNRGVLLLAGIVAFVMGYLILAVHSTNSLLIIVLGWIAILKGLAILILSSSNIRFFSLLNKMRKYFAVIPWFVLIVGIIAVYLGYFA